VTATFRTGDGILVNNEVFMNGTRVGRVSDVKAVDGQAQVEMIVDESHASPLYRDASAEVRKKNLLGETYVEITRGSTAAGAMTSGDQIPVQHTLQTVQIDQVLAILDPQSRQRLQLLINGAGDALANRGADMNDEAHSLNGLASSLNGPANELAVRRQQLDDIVLELQRFYDTLSNQRDQVRQEFGTWNQVMAQLAGQEKSIGATIQQADTLLTNLDGLVTGEVPQLRATLDALPTALTDTQAFFDQSNDIIGGLAPYRRSIHDVFPDLGTSFQDTQANGQHLWSVFSVGDCNSGCATTQPKPSTYTTGAPNATWADAVGGGG
jgi:phospholipid/cholesterol/gamma-HCH transport system substrate-binding protein